MFDQHLVILKSDLTVELFCALRAFDMIWIARPAGPLAALLFQPHTKIQMLASKSKTPFRYIKSSCAKIMPNTHSVNMFQDQPRNFNNLSTKSQKGSCLNNDSARYHMLTTTKLQRRFNMPQQQRFTRYNNEQSQTSERTHNPRSIRCSADYALKRTESALKIVRRKSHP